MTEKSIDRKMRQAVREHWAKFISQADAPDSAEWDSCTIWRDECLRLAAKIRRSPPPAVEGGWREIESAPKDGTRFLTFDDYYGVRMGRAFIRADHDDWLSYVDCNGNSSKGGIRATHWQPLPTPPHPSRRRESR